MQKITDWIGNIYNTHGYIAALVTIVVLVALVVGVAMFTGLDLGVITNWLN